MGTMKTSRSDAFVFFGATGDLAHKQIWPALSALVKAGRLRMPIVAVGRKDIGTDAIRDKAKQSLEESKVFDAAAFEQLSKQLAYVAVDYGDPKTFAGIKQAIGSAVHPLSYVALPPDVFEQVARNLAQAGLAQNGRLVLEKPFGHDAASANALSEALYAHFPEEAIFRIDHYLGKEQVENIVYFRAANPLFESAWNAEHIACVEITMAEAFGVKGRAEFYDGVGAIRDVVQNHLLEVVACLAMELPTEAGHTPLRAARTKLLASVRELDPNDLVRGQVRSYQSEQGVAQGSKTETFAALRLFVDLPRWQGVPFFIRTGKALALTASDATVRFRSLSHPVLDEGTTPPPNTLRFRLGSGNLIALSANLKTPGEAMVGAAGELVLERPSEHDMKPYERLLGDAVDGDASQYAQRDAVEQSWRVFDAALNTNCAPYAYDEHSWGPEEANRVAPEGGWHNPAI
jgi:glucose-6-phosphate 1-dehydrogenase